MIGRQKRECFMRFSGQFPTEMTKKNWPDTGEKGDQGERPEVGEFKPIILVDTCILQALSIG